MREEWKGGGIDTILLVGSGNLYLASAVLKDNIIFGTIKYRISFLRVYTLKPM